MRRFLWLIPVAIATNLTAWAADLDRTRQGVVRIFVIPDEVQSSGQLAGSSGSGFIINDRGTIVTNHHVIANAIGKPALVLVLYASTAEALANRIRTIDDLSAELPKLPGATIAGYDKQKDIAILEPKTPGQGAALTFAPSRFVSPGDRVRAFGYPGLNDRLAASAWVTMSQPSGEVTARFRYDQMNVDVYSISAQVGHGMSGGPLVNDCGEVVAINGEGYVRSYDKPGGPALDVERAAYSIVVDALTPLLDKNHVLYKTAPARCAPASTSDRPVSAVISQRDPLLTGGVLASLVLGVSAVVLASTRRGRAAVKNATDAVSRRLSQQPKQAQSGAPLPAGGGAQSKPHGNPAPNPGVVPLLYGVSGEYAGMELELGEEPVVIGRDPRVSQLVFAADTPGVSGRHCRVRFDPAKQAVVVEDLWSTNGTFVESGQRMASGEPTVIRSTDQFYLGNPEILFEVRY